MSEPPITSSEPGTEAQDRAEAQLGRVVQERYRIDQIAAMGGMGAVYRGVHLKMHKRVAIKMLHPHAERMPELRARFEREAIAGAQIQHPNVAAATDFGELADGTCFLVLEYVRGTTLYELVKRGRLPADRAMRIGRQLASALAAVHAKGIVHRDVKPKNVMIVEAENDLVKLIDFGLAKVPVERLSRTSEPPSVSGESRWHDMLPAGARITAMGVVFGTIGYLAPEAALGMDAVDARADLYALGMLLYEMLAGRHPFDASEPGELFKHQRFTPPPPISERSPGADVPPALEALVMRLLAKAATQRPQTADEVVTEITELEKREATSIAPKGWKDADSAPTIRLGSSRPPAIAAKKAAQKATAQPAKKRGLLGPTLFALVAAAAVVVMLRLDDVARWASGAMGAGSATATATAPATATATARGKATATATATAKASGDAPAGDVDPNGWKAILKRAAEDKEWPKGVQAIVELAKAEPASLAEGDTLKAARDVVTGVGKGVGPDADRAFDTLSAKAGSAGIDVLYAVVQDKGGAKAAERATDLLRKPAVIARGTPAVRIAFALRDAPCDKKNALLDRAVADGDERALIVLQTQAVPCFKKNDALQRAMRDLRAKLQK